MTPYYSDDWLTLYGGDCREVLASLPADSVDCVVTSPPYWGLRDYGTATWIGGDDGHDHIGSQARTAPAGSAKQASKRGSTDVRSGDCSCGAQRIDSQLGLERTPEEYVANMVAVFREVRRVLKPSGTCWLNLGDSYAGYWGDKNAKAEGRRSSADTNGWTNGFHMNAKPGFHEAFDASGLKPKDLVGIPWRVAFALQADGWYLRSDIIWSKSNPMPESVTDRPTKSHEYLFLLTKQPRYFFDADAVREANSVNPDWNYGSERYRRDITQDEQKTDGDFRRPKSSNGWSGFSAAGPNGAGRNIRSVWNIATRPYPGAHFAVFPPELPERCIKAGSSEKGVCPECGAPWVRVVERTVGVTKVERVRNVGGRTDGYTRLPTGGIEGGTTTTTGWEPTCACNTATPLPRPPSEPCPMEGCVLWIKHAGEHTSKPYFAMKRPEPAVILDPFGGSGTVGMVANRLSRRAILIDLNPEYLEQQMKRNAQTPLGLDAA